MEKVGIIMDIMKRIDELCRQRNISIYRLSQLTGISQSAFSKMNRQQSSMTVDNISRVCDGLGISLAQFFSESSEYPDLTASQKQLLKYWVLLSDSKQKLVLEITKKLNDV